MKITLLKKEIILSFKRSYLLFMLLFIAISEIIFLAACLSGFQNIKSHILLIILLFIILRMILFKLAIFKKNLINIIYIDLLLSFLFLCFILICFPQDEMRCIWFYFLVGSSIILLGASAGWVATCLSIAVVFVVRMHDLVQISIYGVSTFSIGLITLASIGHFCTLEAERLKDKLTSAYESLKFTASHDTLTGLLNRAGFCEEAEIIMRVLNENAQPFSIIYLDIDHFKSINDRFGHIGGDAILVAVAQTIRSIVRKSDIVMRAGGEEFVIMMPDANALCAAGAAERLRSAIETKIFSAQDGNSLRITASIGCATSVAPHLSVDTILGNADGAMYRAKHSGRNRVEYANELQIIC